MTTDHEIFASGVLWGIAIAVFVYGLALIIPHVTVGWLP